MCSIHTHLLKSRAGPSESCKITGMATSASVTLRPGGDAEAQEDGGRLRLPLLARLLLGSEGVGRGGGGR